MGALSTRSSRRGKGTSRWLLRRPPHERLALEIVSLSAETRVVLSPPCSPSIPPRIPTQPPDSSFRARRPRFFPTRSRSFPQSSFLCSSVRVSRARCSICDLYTLSKKMQQATPFVAKFRCQPARRNASLTFTTRFASRLYASRFVTRLGTALYSTPTLEGLAARRGVVNRGASWESINSGRSTRTPLACGTLRRSLMGLSMLEG